MESAQQRLIDFIQNLTDEECTLIVSLLKREQA